jgi:prepilin-type N-terminal cleavage/methylation domain-containing protein/prepilin-type processing-associated H-X9-DG protein
MRKIRGFTLVELLVVIGIIALLISILLPTLANARRSGNTVKCLSNIRQVGAALQMYAGDYRGAFPVCRQDPENGAAGATYYWIDLLTPYASRINSVVIGSNASASDQSEFQKTVFFGCTEYDPRTDLTNPNLINAYPGYGLTLHPYLKPGVARNVSETNCRWPGVYLGHYWKLGSVTSAAERMLATDSNLWIIDARASNGGGIAGLPGQPLDWKTNYAGFTGQAGQMDYDMYRHVKRPTVNPNGFYPVSAKAACNVLFFDGHAATLTSLAEGYHAIFLNDPP